MHFLRSSMFAAASLCAGGIVAQADDSAKEPKWHCEIEGKDVDVPANITAKKEATKWCKGQGGKLEAGKKHDDHK